MRKAFILIAGLILLIYLSGCSSSDKRGFYGTYVFKEVSYLSPLSSATNDFINEQMEGTKYTIEADLFKIQSSEYTVEFRSPNYEKEEIQKGSSTLSDINALISTVAESQYSVYDEDGNKTKWRLFVSPDNLWVGTYVDHTGDDSEIIMDIYKLSK